MIDHVRKQPESVRTRYFLFSFGVSTLFVLTLWAFSAKESFSKIAGSEAETDVLKEFHTMTKENIPQDSIKNIMDAGKNLNKETKNMLNEVQTSEEKPQENPLPVEENGKKVFMPPSESEEEKALIPLVEEDVHDKEMQR